MLNKIRELRLARNEEGFTLIELMITVVVIGILSAIAIPIFANQQKAAADAVVKSDLKNVALTFQTFTAREGHVATTGNDMNALKIKLSPRDNYGTTVNYFLVCTNGINYALYAKSISGNSFVYSSATGKLQEDNGFPRTGASACPDAGITNPDWFWSQDSNLVSH